MRTTALLPRSAFVVCGGLQPPGRRVATSKPGKGLPFVIGAVKATLRRHGRHVRLKKATRRVEARVVVWSQWIVWYSLSVGVLAGGGEMESK